jgi:Lon protease-like protein
VSAVDEIPAAALEALPIFPLPDMTLFPGALLPLHVFEPRYRALVADAVAGHKIIAVPRLRPGYEVEYEGRPAVFEVCGAGAIVASEQLPDGRWHIILRGLARVRIERELPPERLYRLVRGRVLPDGPSRAGAGELATAQQALIALVDRLAQAATEELGESLRKLVRAAAAPAACADLVASGMVIDPDARQGLLETPDPAERLEVVTAHVTALLAMGGGASAPN